MLNSMPQELHDRLLEEYPQGPARPKSKLMGSEDEGDDGQDEEASPFWSASERLLKIFTATDLSEIAELVNSYNQDAQDPLWSKYQPALEPISPKQFEGVLELMKAEFDATDEKITVLKDPTTE